MKTNDVKLNLDIINNIMSDLENMSKEEEIEMIKYEDLNKEIEEINFQSDDDLTSEEKIKLIRYTILSILKETESLSKDMLIDNVVKHLNKHYFNFYSEEEVKEVLEQLLIKN